MNFTIYDNRMLSNIIRSSTTRSQRICIRIYVFSTNLWLKINCERLLNFYQTLANDCKCLILAHLHNSTDRLFWSSRHRYVCAELCEHWVYPVCQDCMTKIEIFVFIYISRDSYIVTTTIRQLEWRSETCGYDQKQNRAIGWNVHCCKTTTEL
jgi:hypothetical protein